MSHILYTVKVTTKTLQQGTGKAVETYAHLFTYTCTWVGVKNFGFTEEQKNIEQGSIKLKEGTPCLYHACSKEDGACSKEDGSLAVGSAVKCRKVIFAYVAKRKSSSCTLYVC